MSNFNQYPAPPYGQSFQQPQQQYAQQPQQQYAPQYQQQYNQQPQQQYNPQQQAPQYANATLPPIFMPKESELNERSYDKEQSGINVKFLKIPGPNGQTNWDNSVPVGYQNHAIVWLCPVTNEQMPFCFEERTHFYRTNSKPKGSSIQCLGEGCPMCETPWKPRRTFLYNVILIGDPSVHFTNGEWRPFVLAAGRDLDRALRSLWTERGFEQIIRPETGRPIKITRKKTGTRAQDIEWTAIDCNPQPLGREYYPVLGNLYDLSKLRPAVSRDEVYRVARELGVGQAPQAPNLVWEAQYQQQPTPAQPPAYAPPAYGPPQPQYFGPGAPQLPQAPIGIAHPMPMPTPPAIQSGGAAASGYVPTQAPSAPPAMPAAPTPASGLPTPPALPGAPQQTSSQQAQLAELQRQLAGS